jgi:hypothetical protein
MVHSVGDDEVVSMEKFLIGTLDRIDDVDRFIHKTRAELAARLRALQFASHPEHRARIETIVDRLERDDLPPLDDDDFLPKRLAEITKQ